MDERAVGRSPLVVAGFSWDGESEHACYDHEPIPLPHRVSWSFSGTAQESRFDEGPGSLNAWEMWFPCGENGAYLFVAAWINDPPSRGEAREQVVADLYVGDAPSKVTTPFVPRGVSLDDPSAVFDPLTNRVCVLPDRPQGWYIESRLAGPGNSAPSTIRSGVSGNWPAGSATRESARSTGPRSSG